MTTTSEKSPERATGDQSAPMPSHTPGPWTVVRDKFNRDDSYGTGLFGSVKGDGWFLATIENGPSPEADALLMAAAPAMLTELRQCAMELEEAANVLRPQLSSLARIYDAAAKRTRTAIARATGRQTPPSDDRAEGKQNTEPS